MKRAAIYVAIETTAIALAVRALQQTVDAHRAAGLTFDTGNAHPFLDRTVRAAVTEAVQSIPGAEQYLAKVNTWTLIGTVTHVAYERVIHTEYLRQTGLEYRPEFLQKQQGAC